ncbi:MAG: aspartyl protease family protein [Gemmataceae bacterium]|nr:aspartyl protease family protein [Gemmataceae bacterium]
MRALFAVAAVVAAGGLAGPAPGLDKEVGKTKAGKAGAVVVPFELLSSRHMAVQVKLNGKGPYRLVFDTGAPMNLINNRIAKEAGVVDAKAKRPAFAPFGAMPNAQTIKTLEVGPAKLEKVSTMVMDHPTVAAISEALGPIDGIIGFPFFARYSMTVDYQKKELTLVPNGYVPGDYLEGLMNKMMTASQNQDAAVLAPAGLWGLAVSKEKDDEEAGVVVEAVHAGGAAAAAGVKPGDRLLTVGGRWTDSVADTFRAAGRVKPGKEAAVVVRRDGQEVKLTVKPAKGV